MRLVGIYQRHVLFLAYDKGILICNKGMAWGEHLVKKIYRKTNQSKRKKRYKKR